MFLGQLQGPLDRFRPAVDEVDPLQTLRKLRGQQRCEIRLCLLNKLAVDHHMKVTVKLLPDRVDDSRMPMPQAADGDALDQVDKGAAIGCPEQAPLGRYGRQIDRVISALVT